MAVILSPLDEMRLRRAMQNSPKNRKIQEMQARVEAVRRQEEEKKQKEIETFTAWKNEDVFAQTLEIIRDANTPKSTDDEWNEAFCTSVAMLPAVKRKARELWLEYSAGKEVNGFV